jgi:hypothetical protein
MDSCAICSRRTGDVRARGGPEPTDLCNLCAGLVVVKTPAGLRGWAR